MKKATATQKLAAKLAREAPPGWVDVEKFQQLVALLEEKKRRAARAAQ